MRYLTAFSILVLASVRMSAQPLASPPVGQIAEAYPGFSLAYHGASDATLASSSIVGTIDGKNSERFGVMIGGASTAHVIEIWNDKGALLKAITGADLLGKSSGGVTLASADAVVPGRYLRSVYDVALGGGRIVRLIVKAIATGDPADAHGRHPLLVTYALAGDAGDKLALKVMLPTDGLLDSSPLGFTVSARRSTAAFAAVVSPAPQHVDVAANVVSITSQAVALEREGRETPMLWMQIDGTSGGSPQAARESAVRGLKAAESAVAGPNIIVVSSVDKPNVNPADTVVMTLICVNVGTQNASGVTLRNPVPQGTAYLDKSAGGDDMEIGFDHARVADGTAGEISAVHWTMNGAMKPGEERVASFKTIVR